MNRKVLTELAYAELAKVDTATALTAKILQHMPATLEWAEMGRIFILTHVKQSEVAWLTFHATTREEVRAIMAALPSMPLVLRSAGCVDIAPALFESKAKLTPIAPHWIRAKKHYTEKWIAVVTWFSVVGGEVCCVKIETPIETLLTRNWKPPVYRKVRGENIIWKKGYYYITGSLVKQAVKINRPGDEIEYYWQPGTDVMDLIAGSI